MKCIWGKKCKYREPLGENSPGTFCNYIGMNGGKPRGCSPEVCDKFEPRKGEKIEKGD